MCAEKVLDQGKICVECKPGSYPNTVCVAKNPSETFCELSTYTCAQCTTDAQCQTTLGLGVDATCVNNLCVTPSAPKTLGEKIDAELSANPDADSNSDGVINADDANLNLFAQIASIIRAWFN